MFPVVLRTHALTYHNRSSWIYIQDLMAYTHTNAHQVYAFPLTETSLFSSSNLHYFSLPFFSSSPAIFVFIHLFFFSLFSFSQFKFNENENSVIFVCRYPSQEIKMNGSVIRVFKCFTCCNNNYRKKKIGHGLTRFHPVAIFNLQTKRKEKKPCTVCAHICEFHFSKNVANKFQKIDLFRFY